MEKVTCEERLRGGQGASHADIWGKVKPAEERASAKGLG